MTGPSPRPTGLDADLHVEGRLEAALTVAPGSVVAVIGPNGAGKTTLLRALAGLVTVRGHVTVDGESWTDPPRLVRERRLGFVFQDQSLFPHLSALANVAFGLRARGTARREAERAAQEWLDRLGVGDLAARRPAELSGGQAQRVAIARALAPAPRLLLLDEPFAGLDVGVATSLRIELARHLAAYDGVTLLVTHDALDALTLADRVLVVDDGRVAQWGTPQEVAARPLTEHVARLVGLNVIRSGDTWRSFSPSAVTVSTRAGDDSARLRWRGTIASVAPHGDAVRLLVHTHPADSAQTAAAHADSARSERESTPTRGVELLADVTPGSAAELGLAVGREVWLSVKQTAVQDYAVPPRW